MASGRSYSMKPNLKPDTEVLVTAVWRFAVSGRKIASSCSAVSTSVYTASRATGSTTLDMPRVREHMAAFVPSVHGPRTLSRKVAIG